MNPDISIKMPDLRQRAVELAREQRWPEAQALLQSLLLELPDDVPARMGLARAFSRQGHFRASSEQLLRAAKNPGSDVAACIGLIQQLCFGGEVVVARNCFEHLESIAGTSTSALSVQASLRWMLGEYGPANELMERVSTAGFDSPDAAHFFAVLLQTAGDADKAQSLLEACLRRWPESGDAAVSLSGLRKQTAESNHLNYLEQQLAKLPKNPASRDSCFLRAQFEAARFKELDDLGRYDEAWRALAASSHLMSKLNPYDGGGETAVTEALIATGEALRQAPTATQKDDEGPMPIFIVGMPRSGTTLLDRMLSSHSQVVSAGEINDFLRQLHWTADVPPRGVPGMLESVRRGRTMDLSELGARYLAQTQWRAQGRRYYIDKLPINIQMVPFIRRALPRAPILHMVRDSMDVCFSNFRAMFGNVSAYSYDLRAVAHYYGLYRRLADRWHAILPGSMLDVSYANLVQKPTLVMRQVLAHCGLEVEEACLHPERNAAPVATPSSMQVREPIHTRALGQWRHYAFALEPLRLALDAHSH